MNELYEALRELYPDASREEIERLANNYVSATAGPEQVRAAINDVRARLNTGGMFGRAVGRLKDFLTPPEEPDYLAEEDVSEYGAPPPSVLPKRAALTPEWARSLIDQPPPPPGGADYAHEGYEGVYAPGGVPEVREPVAPPIPTEMPVDMAPPAPVEVPPPSDILAEIAAQPQPELAPGLSPQDQVDAERRLLNQQYLENLPLGHEIASQAIAGNPFIPERPGGAADLLRNPEEFGVESEVGLGSTVAQLALGELPAYIGTGVPAVAALRAIAPAFNATSRVGRTVRRAAHATDEFGVAVREGIRETPLSLGLMQDDPEHAALYASMPLLGGGLGAAGARVGRNVRRGRELERAAIRRPDGQVVTARTTDEGHGTVLDRAAEEAGMRVDDLAADPATQRGFVDAKGRFLPEEAADKRGRETGLLRGIDAGAGGSVTSDMLGDSRTRPLVMADEAIEQTRNSGGATINARLGDLNERYDMAGRRGTAVARQQVRADIGDINAPDTREKLAEFIDGQGHYLIDNPDQFNLGVWTDNDNRLWVEISERLPDDRAIREGQKANQQSVARIDRVAEGNFTSTNLDEIRRGPPLDRGPRVTSLLDRKENPSWGTVAYDYDTPDGPIQVLINPRNEGVIELSWAGRAAGTSSSFTPQPGHKAMREILEDVGRDFPEATTVQYERISGTRGKAADDLVAETGDLDAAEDLRTVEKPIRRPRADPAQAAFVETGGTGEFINPVQVLLRNLEITGPGTTGEGAIAIGAVGGGATGYSESEGMDPGARAMATVVGALGGAFLGHQINTPGFRAQYADGLIQNRPGFARLPGLRRGAHGRLEIDSDFVRHPMMQAEIDRITGDMESFGQVLHHRFGSPLKAVDNRGPDGLQPAGSRGVLTQSEDAIRVEPSGNQTDLPLGRGSSKMAKPQWMAKMQAQFPDATPKELDKLWQKSFDSYVTRIRDKVDAMESMVDWDQLLSYYHRGVGVLDGDKPWYTGVRETVFSVLGEEKGEMFIRFLAATSPQTSAVGEDLGSNIGLAKRAFLQWLNGEVPRPRGKFGESLLDQAVKVDEPYMRLKTPQGGFRSVFNGRKIDNYYRALMGDPEAVVVDMWMGRLFGFEPQRSIKVDKDTGAKSVLEILKLSEGQYSFVENTIRTLAKEQGVTPVEMQAALWMGIKSHWTDLGRSPREIIENYGKTLNRSFANDEGFVEIARRGTGAPNYSEAAMDAARRLKAALRKVDTEEGAAEAAGAAIKLGNQLGFATPDLLRVFARVGAGGLAGGVAGGQATGTPEGAIAGAIGGAALGAGAGRAVSSIKQARQAYQAGRTTRAQAAQEWAEAAVKRRNSAIDAPTSGYHVNEPVDLEEFLGDIDRFNLDAPTDQVMETRAQAIIRERGLPDKAQRSRSRATTKRLAREMGFDISNSNPRKMDDVEVQALKNEINGTTEKLRQIENIINGSGHHSVEELNRLYRLDHQLEQRLGDLLEHFNIARSQFGRNLNSLKYLAEKFGDQPAFWYSRAQKMSGERVLDSATRNRIDELLAAGKTSELQAYIRSLSRASNLDKGITLWKAGLLTAPTTHMANLLGNMSMMGLEASKDAPAVMFDRLMTLATGQRTKGSPFAGAKSLRRGHRGGVEGAVDAAKTGIVPEKLYGKYDLNFSEINFDNPFLNLYTKSIFRGLLAGDAYFRSQALQRSMVDLAEAYASNAGLKGKAYKARVKELLVNPPDDMAAMAVHDAELATFVNDPALSFMVHGVNKGSTDAGNETMRQVWKAASDFTIPFKRTPTNIIERAFEYSPLGPLARAGDIRKLYKLAVKSRATEQMTKVVAENGDIIEVLEQISPGISDAERLLMFQAQRRIANTLGRSAAGSAFALTTGYMLASQDLLSTAWPDDPEEARRWQQEGRQENSVLVDGKWHKLDRISPLGNLIVLGGYIRSEMENIKQIDEPSALDYLVGAGAAAGGGGQSLLQQTFLTGLSENLNVLFGRQGKMRDRVMRVANNYAGSVIPSVIRRYVHGQNPALKEVENPLEAVQANTFPEGIGSVPALPTKVDIFGEERFRADQGLAYLLNPFSRSEDKRQTDDVIKYFSDIGLTVPGRNSWSDESEKDFKQRLGVEGELIKSVTRQLREANPVVNVFDEATQREEQIRFIDMPPEYQRGVLSDSISAIRRDMTAAFKQLYMSESGVASND